MAAVRAALHCGVVLPDGKRVQPKEVLYLGYSLGTMVGILARSVEPELGTAVLFAPGGDISGWLMLQLTPRFSAPYVSCLGGPQHGESCFPSGLCAAPGVCTMDPHLYQLASLLELPYALAGAGADPLELAVERTGRASKARALLLTGAEDGVLHPMLATRLGDALGQKAYGPHRYRGPRTLRIDWPHLGHELVQDPAVRAVAYEFLASRGRRIAADAPPSAVDKRESGR
jgi:hypothetical protein